MIMRFGMGILLTPEENAIIGSIVKTCYAALGLANDYISFDVEWEEYQNENRGPENSHDPTPSGSSCTGAASTSPKQGA